MAASQAVVAGVDVGGPVKGFHAISLSRGRLSGIFQSRNAREVAGWCRDQGAFAIGVDAPSAWSTTGRARPCERELMKEGIGCFSTPTRLTALQHPTGYYGWMLAGEDLYQELRITHALFDGRSFLLTSPVCFETFPQAVACALAGDLVSAKDKSSVRPRLLVKAGVDIRVLTSIDFIDAAMCALAAQGLINGQVRSYGQRETGLIICPLGSS